MTFQFRIQTNTYPISIKSRIVNLFSTEKRGANTAKKPGRENVGRENLEHFLI